MGFLDKFLNKFTNKASDKLADKAINKIFGKDNKNNNTTQTPAPQANAVPPTNEMPQTAQPTSENISATEAKSMAMLSMLSQLKGAQATNAQVDMAQVNMAQMGMMQNNMAYANEIMSYLIFDDDMEVIGVKDNAPDYLKMAFKSGKLNSKD